jgi:hypothetical protein
VHLHRRTHLLRYTHQATSESLAPPLARSGDQRSHPIAGTLNWVVPLPWVCSSVLRRPPSVASLCRTFAAIQQRRAPLPAPNALTRCVLAHGRDRRSHLTPHARHAFAHSGDQLSHPIARTRIWVGLLPWARSFCHAPVHPLLPCAHRKDDHCARSVCRAVLRSHPSTSHARHALAHSGDQLSHPSPELASG